MRVISESECLEWCANRGIDTGGEHPQFRGDQQVFRLSLPSVGLKIVAMSGLLSSLRSGAADPETLVWLTDWGMWSESFDAVGSRLWERIVSGYGFPRPGPSDARGLLFEASECDDERAVLTSIMLFQWDATVVPRDGAHFVRISHDGHIDIHAKTDHVASEIAEPIAAWKQREECTP